MLDIYKGRRWWVFGLSCYSENIDGEKKDVADDWEIKEVTSMSVTLEHKKRLVVVKYSCD